MIDPKEAHRLALSKGFYANATDLETHLFETASARLQDHAKATFLVSRLALIACEVSEAIECVARGKLTLTVDPETGKPEGLPAELADIELRLADLFGALKIDRDAVVAQKHEYNKTRPIMHGGKKL